MRRAQTRLALRNMKVTAQMSAPSASVTAPSSGSITSRTADRPMTSAASPSAPTIVRIMPPAWAVSTTTRDASSPVARDWKKASPFSGSARRRARRSRSTRFSEAAPANPPLTTPSAQPALPTRAPMASSARTRVVPRSVTAASRAAVVRNGRAAFARPTSSPRAPAASSRPRSSRASRATRRTRAASAYAVPDACASSASRSPMMRLLSVTCPLRSPGRRPGAGGRRPSYSSARPARPWRSPRRGAG